MAEIGLHETRELLLGTWISVALAVELLIDRELICREDILLALAEAESLSSDKRRTAIAGMRLLIERGFS